MPQYIRGNNMRLYIVGAAGSGKTTFADKISNKLGFVVTILMIYIIITNWIIR